MSFRDTIAGAIKLANSLTKPLQATVQHKSVQTSTGASTERTFTSPVSRKALVEWKMHEIRTGSGRYAVSRATVTFLDPTVVVTNEDILILPDGSTGPILDIQGLTDPQTGRPYMTQVFLG